VTMQDKLVALVSGATKGMGLQIAKDLVVRGSIVLGGSRRRSAGSFLEPWAKSSAARATP
jgi:NAD(P)-dependent dehydrogenase (short-subunit alcohol dehydrogenase family)